MKTQVNMRMSESSQQKLDFLTERYGTQTTAVEIAIHDLYEKEIEMTNQTVKEFDYRDVTVFVDQRDDGYYVCYEGTNRNGMISGSQDVGPFDSVDDAAQAGRDMRDAHDDR